MVYISCVVLFSAALIGGLAVFIFDYKSPQWLKLILSFSGAYLFTITVLHLIPEVYESDYPNIGYYVLLGFFIQIVLEQFSKGVEHGHIHIHDHSVMPMGVLFGLGIHSFLEGMPLNINSHDTAAPLLTGIALHKIPAAFALTSVLVQSKVKKLYVIVLLLVFAAMSPLGVIVSKVLNDVNAVSDIHLFADKIMAIVIGLFLHISTTILFESSENHRFGLYKMIVIVIGFTIGVLSI